MKVYKNAVSGLPIPPGVTLRDGDQRVLRASR